MAGLFSWITGGGGGGDNAAAPAPAPTTVAPPGRCIRRINNDVRSLLRDHAEALYAVQDETNALKVDALVEGPADTPYEGGVFHFKVLFPPTYPVDHPSVELVTTAEGRVGFNPNLYATGKVCLSILGTWAGPSWSPTQSLGSVLLSIQSLLHAEPYANEPGREAAGDTPRSRDYNEFLRYATLRYACAEQVDPASAQHGAMPPELRRWCAAKFLERYERVLELVDAAIAAGRDGSSFRDPTGRSTASGVCDYQGLRTALVARRADAEALVARGDEEEAEEDATVAAGEAPAPASTG